MKEFVIPSCSLRCRDVRPDAVDITRKVLVRSPRP